MYVLFRAVHSVVHDYVGFDYGDSDSDSACASIFLFVHFNEHHYNKSVSTKDHQQ